MSRTNPPTAVPALPPSGIITLLTDFGPGSPYVGAMKAAILRIFPAAILVDLTHAIPPQDIRQAAWVLHEVAPLFSDGTIHVAVVDPGVGTERGIIHAQLDRQHYLAPDNGLLSLCARQAQSRRIIRLTETEYWSPNVSATFHGRDIMAPVAARLGLGLDPTCLGREQQDLVQLAWPEVKCVPGKIEGTVSMIDSFGNLVTDITSQQLEGVPTDERVRIACDEHETCGIFRTYGEQPAMTLIALVGSSGKLELAIVNEHAARMLGISTGAPVTITW